MLTHTDDASKNNTYYLTQTLGEEMPIETAFLLIDILLSLKTITKAETEGVIEEVISATGLHAGVELKEYILNKLLLFLHQTYIDLKF